MFKILKSIYPLRLAPVSEDSDKAAEILCKELDFKVHEYPSGEKFNGWTVPDSWKALEAKIYKDGNLIYDGMAHPLGVIGYSDSFEGKISLEELKKHLFYHPKFPDALVYHCDYFYKPWKKDWGFSLPYNLYENLEDGEYDIKLKTSYEKGTLKVLDYFLEGESKDTIILNAHNCHAAQANDDIAGVVVAIQVIRELAKRKKRKYSYRVIIAPEHFGSIFYLKNLNDKEIANFKYAMFLEMLGTKNNFALQESFNGTSLIDQAAHNYLKHNFSDSVNDKFRKIVGNDETVWEAPGYEVPCISLSRTLYPEYHSNLDNEDIIFEDKLNEAAKTVLGIIDILEHNYKIKRNFKGLIALSNPKYDLYISAEDPSIRNLVNEKQRRWNYLMDCLIRYFDEKMTILDIAIKHDLNFADLYSYIKKYEDKGLISFV